MKTFIVKFSLALVLTFVIFTGAARAQDATGDSSVSFQTFYDQLAGQGNWIQTSQYGNVWQPNESDSNWRPYTYGHWVNTDQGMTWVSDESFGWATYHYGRWTNIDGTGWVWVPGYTWAPAWVSWRGDSDDVGWAPLPPASDEGIDYYNNDDSVSFDFGFHIGDDCDTAYGIGPGWYNFCPIAYIGDRDCWRHFRDHRDNFAFIGRTRNFTNINFHRDGRGGFGHVRAEGPSVAALNARANHRIETAQLSAVTRPGEAGLHGHHLGVFAPRVDAATFRTAHPSHVNGVVGSAAVNRGTDINRPLEVNSRVRTANATAAQIHAAQVAQGSTLASAQIATANTHFTRSLNQPLTTLRTNTRAETQTVRGNAPAGYADSASRGQRTPVATPSSSSAAELQARQAQVRRESNFSRQEDSRYTGENVRSQAVAPARTAPVFHNNAQAFAPSETYHHSSVFSSGAPAAQTQRTFERSGPAFQSQPAFHQNAPVYHPSAPAYHPAQSFRSAAPAPVQHFNGGGAPAARSAPSGGGGHAQASGGGGRAAAPGNGGGHR